MLALLGSRALAFYCDIGRTPMDTDLLGSYDDCVEYIKQLGKRERILCNYPAESGKKIIVKTAKGVRDDTEPNIYEYEICWGDDNSSRLADIIFASCEIVKDKYGTEMALPHLDVLYMLKLSHRFKKNSPHFLKTLNDLKLMESAGAKFPEQYREWFVEREKLTYTNTTPKLNVGKKDFFTDDVPYTYDHDSVHMAIKFLDKPAYHYFKEDENEVMVSREMFFKLPRQIQLLSVVEEAMTLAIERALVPFPDGMSPKQAFDYALSKCCTSIASGFWREFAYDNYSAVQELYDPTYFERFKAGVDSGVVTPHK